jgi:DNA polymerase-3 subunit delta
MEVLAAPRLPEVSVFLLAGPDDFLREQVLDRLRHEVLDPGFADFNHCRIHCTSGTKSAAILAALLELPMMTDRRLVEIHEAQSLPADVAKALIEPLEETGRTGGTVVALCWRPAGRGGGTSPLREAAARMGLHLDCTLAEADRPAWVQAALQRLKVQADGAAVSEILQRTGSDLRHLASQLEKLALYAGPGARINREDVRKVVLRSTEVKTWELTAAIGKRDLRSAVRLAEILLEEGEQPGGLLSYLNSYLRSLAQIQALAARHGSSAANLAREVPGKKEFQIRKTLEELRTWSDRDLQRAFELVCRADLRVKTGQDPRLILELLLVDLCHRRGPQRPG